MSSWANYIRWWNLVQPLYAIFRSVFLFNWAIQKCQSVTTKEDISDCHPAGTGATLKSVQEIGSLQHGMKNECHSSSCQPGTLCTGLSDLHGSTSISLGARDWECCSIPTRIKMKASLRTLGLMNKLPKCDQTDKRDNFWKCPWCDAVVALFVPTSQTGYQTAGIQPSWSWHFRTTARV